MKIFIWIKLEHVSERFHEGGGLVVVADSVERAKEIAEGNCVRFRGSDFPDAQYEIDVVNPVAESIFIFPNAGCC